MMNFLKRATDNYFLFSLIALTQPRLGVVCLVERKKSESLCIVAWFKTISGGREWVGIHKLCERICLLTGNNNFNASAGCCVTCLINHLTSLLKSPQENCLRISHWSPLPLQTKIESEFLAPQSNSTPFYFTQAAADLDFRSMCRQNAFSCYGRVCFSFRMCCYTKSLLFEQFSENVSLEIEMISPAECIWRWWWWKLHSSGATYSLWWLWKISWTFKIEKA